jgi:cytochrome c oxidase cbb3-type subunit 3
VLLLLGLLLLLLAGPARAEVRAAATQPLLVVRVNKTMAQAVSDLQVAIANNNFVFIRKQDIYSRLGNSKQKEGHVVLIYFCNFYMLDHALKQDLRVGVFLPCKITLIQKKGYVEMVAINPRAISSQLDEQSLQSLCMKLTHDYGEILQEAEL